LAKKAGSSKVSTDRVCSYERSRENKYGHGTSNSAGLVLYNPYAMDVDRGNRNCYSCRDLAT